MAAGKTVMMTWCALALAAVSLVGPASAHGDGAEALSPYTAMKNDELSRIRAGYTTVDGVTFAFGVSIDTLIDGQPALASTLNVLGPNGVTRTVTAASAGVLTQTPQGATLALVGAGGLTTLSQQIGSQGIENLLSTSASNQSFKQSTNVNVTLLGFQQNQAAYALQQTANALANQVNFAMMLAGRH